MMSRTVAAPYPISANTPRAASRIIWRFWILVCSRLPAGTRAGIGFRGVGFISGSLPIRDEPSTFENIADSGNARDVLAKRACENDVHTPNLDRRLKRDS